MNIMDLNPEEFLAGVYKYCGQFPADDWVKQGTDHLKGGFQEKALNCLKMALLLEPFHLSALVLKAKLDLINKDFWKADDAIASILKRNPLHQEALLIKSSIHVRRNEIEEALGTLGDILEQDPFHIDALLLRAELFIKQKKWQQAWADLLNVKQVKPRAYSLLAEIFFEQRDFAQAKECVEKGLELDSQCAEAYLLRAKITLRPNSAKGYFIYQSARADLNQVLEIDPENLEAASLLKSLDSISEMSPLEVTIPSRNTFRNIDVENLYNKAKEVSSKKCSGLALLYTRRAIKLKPDHQGVLMAKAGIHIEEYKQLLSALRKIIDAEHSDALSINAQMYLKEKSWCSFSSRKKRAMEMGQDAPRCLKRVADPIEDETLTKKRKLAPIGISYRGHMHEKDGEGMLFDHMRFQEITQFPTVALMPRDQGTMMAAESHFSNSLQKFPRKLPFDQSITQDSNNIGLLVIPGRVHKTEDEAIRLNHEYSEIRNALNRGQPMLGICAGAWRVYEQMLTWSKKPQNLNINPITRSKAHKKTTLVDADDHNYNGGMIRLGTGKKAVTHNTQIHDIKIKKNSMLKSALRTDSKKITVNSVHWKAVNENQLPRNTTISARSKINPAIDLKSRSGEPMVPERDTVEAFETKIGAPIFGIQWHAEAYTDGPHSELLKYCALAGQAYFEKRKVLEQLKEIFSQTHFDLLEKKKRKALHAIKKVESNKDKKFIENVMNSYNSLTSDYLRINSQIM